MKDQTCCFTGHRVIEKEKSPKIEKRLEEEIINLIYQGICYFATGGALGFDTIAAMTVLKLKNDFSHIRLILVLPCKDQQEFWKDSDKKIYDQILNEADNTNHSLKPLQKIFAKTHISKLFARFFTGFIIVISIRSYIRRSITTKDVCISATAILPITAEFAFATSQNKAAARHILWIMHEK